MVYENMRMRSNLFYYSLYFFFSLVHTFDAMYRSQPHKFCVWLFAQYWYEHNSLNQTTRLHIVFFSWRVSLHRLSLVMCYGIEVMWQQCIFMGNVLRLSYMRTCVQFNAYDWLNILLNRRRLVFIIHLMCICNLFFCRLNILHIHRYTLSHTYTEHCVRTKNNNQRYSRHKHQWKTRYVTHIQTTYKDFHSCLYCVLDKRKAEEMWKEWGIPSTICYLPIVINALYVTALKQESNIILCWLCAYTSKRFSLWAPKTGLIGNVLRQNRKVLTAKRSGCLFITRVSLDWWAHKFSFVPFDNSKQLNEKKVNWKLSRISNSYIYISFFCVNV